MSFHKRLVITLCIENKIENRAELAMDRKAAAIMRGKTFHESTIFTQPSI